MPELPFTESKRVNLQRIIEHVIGACMVVGLLVAFQQPARDNARLETEFREQSIQIRAEIRDLREDLRRLVVRIDTDFYIPSHRLRTPANDRRDPPTPETGYIEAILDRRRLEVMYG